MRASLLMTSSYALVAAALVAIVQPALAQEVPVVYRTDPGEAHPRYAPEPPPVEQAQPMHISGNISGQTVSGSAAPQAITAQPYAVNAYQVPASYTAGSAYSTGTITVQPGDTVYGLARRYGVAPTDIIALNGLYAPYKLSIGQRLALPDAPASVAPTPVAVAAAMSTPVSSVPAAPLSSAPMPTADMAERIYMVRQGDTLYRLSRQFGVPVQTLAQANNLYPPYALALDQALRIPGPGPSYGGSYQTQPMPGQPQMAAPQIVTPQENLGVQPILVSKNPNARFAWPIRGALLREFGVGADGQRYDGISIAAPIGAPIRAVEDGEVVYTGTDLEGYGNLLLINHEGGWVSAYAHTDSIMVRKGDKVRQGQVVAKVGKSGDVAQSQLHFELRHDLQPRDPLMALTGQDMLARADFR